ncbi:MAG: PepSY domain-containing protein [Alphaproteobacteria bacterium]|nr:PepSY domain-containing protein [Alphaproteobacteria bacterium]
MVRRLILAALMVAMASQGALAAPARLTPGEERPSPVLRVDLKTSDQILSNIRKRYPGRPNGPVEGPRPGPDGRLVYVIRWLTDTNEVMFITVDAESGQIISALGGR